MTIYPRIILTGTLTTQSSFHIGSGREAIIEDQDTRFNQLCLDSNNKPYIPASSLRGYLRSVISQHSSSSRTSEIFGLARQTSEAAETGNSGSLRIYDCRWHTGDIDTQLLSRTRIDPVTGTAKQHHLANHNMVAPHSQFSVHMELDKASDVHLEQVLKALQTLNVENQGKLGQGKSTGQGKLNWQIKSLQVLTKEKLKEWLTQSNKNATKKGRINYKNLHKKGKLENYLNNYSIDKIEPYVSKHLTINIQLTANSPLLINDPQSVKKREQENKEAKTPDLIYKSQQNYAIIPGSTLKGWTRARGRRILLTLLDINGKNQEPEQTADNLLGQLFGNTQQLGCLQFDDALVEIKKQEHQHPQTFNAIDRFTGGVKNKALYNVEAIWPDKKFIGQIHQVNKLNDWMKLLLLYILKDSMQGDLVLGWGKSKGYGRLQLTVNEQQNWESLYSTLQESDLILWETDLQQKIEGEAV